MVSTVIEQIEQLRTDYIYHYVIIGNAKQHVVWAPLTRAPWQLDVRSGSAMRAQIIVNQNVVATSWGYVENAKVAVETQ